MSVTNETQTAPATVDSAPSAMLNVQTIADMLRCSTRHVYRLADAGRMPRPLAKAGRIPHLRAGRRLMFNPEAVGSILIDRARRQGGGNAAGEGASHD